jgi:hypothetical protein
LEDAEALADDLFKREDCKFFSTPHRKKIRGAEAEADDAEAVVEEDIRGQVVHQRRRERRK